MTQQANQGEEDVTFTGKVTVVHVARHQAYAALATIDKKLALGEQIPPNLVMALANTVLSLAADLEAVQPQNLMKISRLTVCEDVRLVPGAIEANTDAMLRSMSLRNCVRQMAEQHITERPPGGLYTNVTSTLFVFRPHRKYK